MAFLRFMGDEAEAQNYSYGLEVGGAAGVADMGGGQPLEGSGQPQRSHNTAKHGPFSSGDRTELKQVIYDWSESTDLCLSMIMYVDEIPDNFRSLDEEEL
ncbi:hypothetical protein CRG98_015448 [Punica granatum]|uniref:Uncharacterized protein n=1 Tax=Punica granatum TaxID=22663 RepID=A0A2I0K7S8_PUNGR|nr:hypothetical protein CRG98_015448 [Punica granatum]